MGVKTVIKSLLHALVRSLVELAESESGEFLTTREKSRLLYDMLHHHERLQRRSGTANSGQFGTPSFNYLVPRLHRPAPHTPSPAR